MAWIYLAESEESQKPWKDTSGQSPTVKTTDTLKESFFQEWLQETYPSLPSGMMSKQSLKGTLPPPSISSMAVFPAKTFPLPDAERAWQESEADYFSRSSGSLAKYDPDSCSWRTFQRLLFEEPNELLESFVAYGMTVAGEFYPLRMWERIIEGNDGGYWPTPQAQESGKNLELYDKTTGRYTSTTGRTFGYGLSQAVKLWPTPRATEWKDARPSLKSRENGKLYEGLSGYVKMYPTQTLADSKNVGRNGSHQDNLHKHFNGQLNPQFVEWLMGYPCEWTALEDWATQWYRPKREKRLKG